MRAIDQGLIPGPRIYPSGAFISQTSGHGDFRMPYEVPRGICGHLTHAEIEGASAIADGADEVLRAAREPGALADLLLVNGNPLDDLSLVATPETSFAVIMKDGVIHRNLLS